MSAFGYSPCILIIEDDPLMALLLKDLLDNYNYKINISSGVIDDVLHLLRSEYFDFVVLDVRLHSFDAFIVAQYLFTHDIPFAFSTGQEQTSIPPRYQDVPFFQKPYDVDLLHKLIQEQFQRSGKEAFASITNSSLKKFPQCGAL